jgi:hypothetical protein
MVKERFLAGCGMLFVLVLLAGVGLAGDAGTKDGDRIASYFADHRTLILWRQPFNGLVAGAFGSRATSFSLSAMKGARLT